MKINKHQIICKQWNFFCFRFDSSSMIYSVMLSWNFTNFMIIMTYVKKYFNSYFFKFCFLFKTPYSSRRFFFYFKVDLKLFSNFLSFMRKIFLRLRLKLSNVFETIRAFFSWWVFAIVFDVQIRFCIFVCFLISHSFSLFRLISLHNWFDHRLMITLRCESKQFNEINQKMILSFFFENLSFNFVRYLSETLDFSEIFVIHRFHRSFFDVWQNVFHVFYLRRFDIYSFDFFESIKWFENHFEFFFSFRSSVRFHKSFDDSKL